MQNALLISAQNGIGQHLKVLSSDIIRAERMVKKINDLDTPLGTGSIPVPNFGSFKRNKKKEQLYHYTKWC